jgi:hypothetical protein
MRTPSRIHRVSIAIALGFLLTMRCAAAADDAMLQICLGAAADYSPMFPTQTIPASAQEVTAVFRFAKGETHKSVTGTWIAVDVGAAAPPNHVLVKSTQKEMMAQGRLWFSLPRALPVGKYRLDVEADGKAWKSAEFSVVPDLAAPQLSGPEALVPTKPGQTWNYDFVQQAGGGAKINFPDIKPDTEGKYRATVEIKMIGKDSAGDHVEMRRNGRLVFEEWWRVDRQGFAATKRKAGEEVSVLDPPQVLFPGLQATSKKWEYTPRDRSYHQAYRMIGPLAIRTAAGEKTGYVVLVEQSEGRMGITVERHFVPGTGMVREIIVTALDHDMVSRQEMTLKQ